MAKKSMVMRERKRARMVAKYAARRAELKAITLDSPVQLPRPDSIARRLIEEWLAEG